MDKRAFGSVLFLLAAIVVATQAVQLRGKHGYSASVEAVTALEGSGSNARTSMSGDSYPQQSGNDASFDERITKKGDSADEPTAKTLTLEADDVTGDNEESDGATKKKHEELTPTGGGGDDEVADIIRDAVETNDPQTGFVLVANPHKKDADDEPAVAHKEEDAEASKDGKPLFVVEADDEGNQPEEKVGLVLDADVEDCGDIRIQRECARHDKCKWEDGFCENSSVSVSDEDIASDVDAAVAENKKVRELKGKLAEVEQKLARLAELEKEDELCSSKDESECKDPCTTHDGKCRSKSHKEFVQLSDEKAALEDEKARVSKEIESNSAAAKGHDDAIAKGKKDLEAAGANVAVAAKKVDEAKDALTKAEEEYDTKNTKCMETKPPLDNFEMTCEKKGCVVQVIKNGLEECIADKTALEAAQAAVEAAEREKMDAIAAETNIDDDIGELENAKVGAGASSIDSSNAAEKDLAEREKLREAEMSKRNVECAALSKTPDECEKNENCKLDINICLGKPLPAVADESTKVDDAINEAHDKLKEECPAIQEETDCKDHKHCEWVSGKCEPPAVDAFRAEMDRIAEEAAEKKCQAIQDADADWQAACDTDSACEVRENKCMPVVVTAGISVSDRAADAEEQGDMSDVDPETRKCAACMAVVDDLKAAGAAVSGETNLLAQNGHLLIDAKSMCNQDHLMVVAHDNLNKVYNDAVQCTKEIANLFAEGSDLGKFLSFGCGSEKCKAVNICSAIKNGDKPFCTNDAEETAVPGEATEDAAAYEKAFAAASAKALNAELGDAHTLNAEKTKVQELKTEVVVDEEKEAQLQEAVSRDKLEISKDDADLTHDNLDATPAVKTLVFLKDRISHLKAHKLSPDFVAEEKKKWAEKWEDIVGSVSDAGIKARLTEPLGDEPWPAKVAGHISDKDAEMLRGVDIEHGKKGNEVAVEDSDDESDVAQPNVRGGKVTVEDSDDGAKLADPESKSSKNGEAIASDDTLKGDDAPKENHGENGALDAPKDATNPTDLEKNKEEHAAAAERCAKVTLVKGKEDETCDEARCGIDLEANKCVPAPDAAVCKEVDGINENKEQECHKRHCLWLFVMDELDCVTPAEVPELEKTKEQMQEVAELLAERNDMEDRDENKPDNADGETSGGSKGTHADHGAHSANSSNDASGSNGGSGASATSGASADDIAAKVKGHKDEERKALGAALVAELKEDKDLEKAVKYHMESNPHRAQAIVNLFYADPELKKHVQKEMGWTAEEMKEAEKEADSVEAVNKVEPKVPEAETPVSPSED